MSNHVIRVVAKNSSPAWHRGADQFRIGMVLWYKGCEVLLLYIACNSCHCCLIVGLLCVCQQTCTFSYSGGNKWHYCTIHQPHVCIASLRTYHKMWVCMWNLISRLEGGWHWEVIYYSWMGAVYVHWTHELIPIHIYSMHHVCMWCLQTGLSHSNKSIHTNYGYMLYCVRRYRE